MLAKRSKDLIFVVSLISPRRSSYARGFSPICRQISLFTFGTFLREFGCLYQDSRPPGHMSDDFGSFGGQAMIPEFSEISKHITCQAPVNVTVISKYSI